MTSLGDRLAWTVKRLQFSRRIVAARSALLQLGGFALLSYAAYGWSHVAGYAAAGVSLLLVEWLSKPEGGHRR